MLAGDLICCIPYGICYLECNRSVKRIFVPRKSKARPDLASIGRRIRELRGGERQDDLSPELGITQGQLSKIERGMSPPSVEVLLRLRRRFGRSIDWMLTGEG